MSNTILYFKLVETDTTFQLKNTTNEVIDPTTIPDDNAIVILESDILLFHDNNKVSKLNTFLQTIPEPYIFHRTLMRNMYSWVPPTVHIYLTKNEYHNHKIYYYEQFDHAFYSIGRSGNLFDPEAVTNINTPCIIATETKVDEDEIVITEIEEYQKKYKFTPLLCPNNSLITWYILEDRKNITKCAK